MRIEINTVVQKRIKALLPYSVMLLSACSVYFSLLSDLLVSMLFAISATAAFLFGKKLSHVQDVDHSTMELIENMLSRPNVSISLSERIIESIPPDSAFSEEMKNAIAVYRYSGSTAALKAVAAKYNSEPLKEAVYAMAHSLESGAPVAEMLSEIKFQFEEEKSKALGTGKLRGMDSIVNIGVLVFFPMFAGISVNIINITSSISSMSLSNVSVLVAVIGFYVASAAATLSKYGPGIERSVKLKASNSSFMIMLALLVFRSSMVLGRVMLRW